MITIDQAHYLRLGGVRALGIDVELNDFPRLHRDLVRVPKELELCHIRIPTSLYFTIAYSTDTFRELSLQGQLADQAGEVSTSVTCAVFSFTACLSSFGANPGSGPGLTNVSTTLARRRETLFSKLLIGSDWPKAIELHEKTAPPFGA